MSLLSEMNLFGKKLFRKGRHGIKFPLKTKNQKSLKNGEAKNGVLGERNDTQDKVKVIKKEGKPTYIGEILVSKGVITEEQLRYVLMAQQRLRQQGVHLSVGTIIVRMGFAQPSVIEEVALEGGKITFSEVESIPFALQKKYKIKVIGIKNKKLQVATLSRLTEVTKQKILEEVSSLNIEIENVEVIPYPSDQVMIYLEQKEDIDHDLLIRMIDAACKDPGDVTVITELVDGIFKFAIKERVSDVHFERSKEEMMCWISMRIDGDLKRISSLTKAALDSIMTRIKLMADIDIAEMITPLDGRLEIKMEDGVIDARVSTNRLWNDESIVIRLLDSSSIAPITIQLGPHNEKVAKRIYDLTRLRQKSGGIILATGSTGQGKSTTLASIVYSMPREKKKILTIEDPIEYRLPFVQQRQAVPQAGLTFSKALRSYMRQDPDAMMVGEVRDRETAEEFLRGSETGHMMISTLHTDNALSAIPRLLNMLDDEQVKTAELVLGDMIKCILNQRLIKRLCPYCKVETEKGYVAKGCSHCGGDGYLGRVLVLESLFLDKVDKVKAQEIIRDGRYEDLVDLEGVFYRSLYDSALDAFKMGLIDYKTLMITAEEQNLFSELRKSGKDIFLEKDYVSTSDSEDMECQNENSDLLNKEDEP